MFKYLYLNNFFCLDKTKILRNVLFFNVMHVKSAYVGSSLDFRNRVIDLYPQGENEIFTLLSPFHSFSSAVLRN